MIRWHKIILEGLVQHKTGTCPGMSGKPVEDCQFLGDCVSLEVVEENDRMTVRKIMLAMSEGHVLMGGLARRWRTVSSWVVVSLWRWWRRMTG